MAGIQISGLASGINWNSIISELITADSAGINQVKTQQASVNNQISALGSLSTQGFIGCYVLLTLEGQTLTLNAYGMTASGGSVAGDTVIDTVVFGQ